MNSRSLTTSSGKRERERKTAWNLNISLLTTSEYLEEGGQISWSFRTGEFVGYLLWILIFNSEQTFYMWVQTKVGRKLWWKWGTANKWQQPGLGSPVEMNGSRVVLRMRVGVYVENVTAPGGSRVDWLSVLDQNMRLLHTALPTPVHPGQPAGS